jgi:PIN domain nuclease of toxin-antitoxin system
MGTARITVDTHSLLWYMDKGQNESLSSLALETIIRAEERGIIYVPAIALMEALFLIEKGRFSLRGIGQNKQQQAAYLLAIIEESDIYSIVPIDAELLRATIPLKGLDIHDRLILATAILTDSALVSKDREIGAKGANVVW